MDPTLISVLALEASVLGVGAALAALIVTGVRSLRTEIAAVGTRLGERIDGLESGLRADLAGFEARLTERLRLSRDTQIYAFGRHPLLRTRRRG